MAARSDGQLPAVRAGAQPLTHQVDGHARPVTVIRVDATIIESATMKPGVAGHFKGGITARQPSGSLTTRPTSSSAAR